MLHRRLGLLIAILLATSLCTGTLEAQTETGSYACAGEYPSPGPAYTVATVPTKLKSQRGWMTSITDYATTNLHFVARKILDSLGPHPLVDGCGFSRFLLPLSSRMPPIMISSGLHNLSSSVGYQGTIPLNDERLAFAGRYGDPDEDGVTGFTIFTLRAGMVVEAFKEDSGAYNPNEPDRIYSSAGTGRYVKKSAVGDYVTTSQIIVYGPGQLQSIYTVPDRWKINSPKDSGPQMYFLTKQLGPAQNPASPAGQWQRVITWDPNLDRIMSDKAGNVGGTIVQYNLTYTYSSNVPNLSRLTAISDIRNGVTRTWSLSEKITDASSATPGFLRRVTDPDGYVTSLYYDPVGRLDSVFSSITGSGSIKFEYFKTNTVKAVNGPGIYTPTNTPQRYTFSNPTGSYLNLKMTDALTGNDIAISGNGTLLLNAYSLFFSQYYADPVGIPVSVKTKYNGSFSLYYDGSGQAWRSTTPLQSADNTIAYPAANNPFRYVKQTSVDSSVSSTKSLISVGSGSASEWSETRPFESAKGRTGYDSEGRLYCHLIQPGNVADSGCYSTGIKGSGLVAAAWICEEQGPYFCKVVLIDTGKKAPDGSPMGNLKLTLTPRTDAEWLVATMQVEIDGQALPLVTYNYNAAGERISTDIPGVYKEVLKDFTSWFGNLGQDVYPAGSTGPLRSSSWTYYPQGAPKDMTSYTGDVLAWGFDSAKNKVTTFKDTKNSQNTSMSLGFDANNQENKLSAGISTQSSYQSDSVFKPYVATPPSDTPLYTRVVHECSPQVLNVPNASGYFVNAAHGNSELDQCVPTPQPYNTLYEDTSPSLQGPQLILWKTQQTTCPFLRNNSMSVTWNGGSAPLVYYPSPERWGATMTGNPQGYVNLSISCNYVNGFDLGWTNAQVGGGSVTVRTSASPWTTSGGLSIMGAVSTAPFSLSFGNGSTVTFTIKR